MILQDFLSVAFVLNTEGYPILVTGELLWHTKYSLIEFFLPPPQSNITMTFVEPFFHLLTLFYSISTISEWNLCAQLPKLRKLRSLEPQNSMSCHQIRVAVKKNTFPWVYMSVLYMSEGGIQILDTACKPHSRPHRPNGPRAMKTLTNENLDLNVLLQSGQQHRRSNSLTT